MHHTALKIRVNFMEYKSKLNAPQRNQSYIVIVNSRIPNTFVVIRHTWDTMQKTGTI